MKKLIVYLVSTCMILAVLAGAVASCTSTPAPTASPSPTQAPKPTATPTPTSTAPAAQTITWKYFGTWAAGTDAAYQSEYFKNTVEKLTNGRLKIELYPAGQLYPAEQQYTAIQKGLAQLQEGSPSQFGNAFPLGTFVESPLLVRSNTETRMWWEGGLDKIYSSELEKQGIVEISFHGANPLQMASKKPIRTLADFNGIKVRVYGESYANGFKALGATPVSMGFQEVYPALQAGTVDAVTAGTTWLFSGKFHEVAKNIDMINFGVAMVPVQANKAALDSLPQDLRNAVLWAGQITADMAWGRMDMYGDDAVRKWNAAGATVINYSADEYKKWEEKIAPIWWQAADKCGPSGTQALDILNKLFPGRVPPKGK